MSNAGVSQGSKLTMVSNHERLSSSKGITRLVDSAALGLGLSSSSDSEVIMLGVSLLTALGQETELDQTSLGLTPALIH
jgi:hypothetical protein